MKTLAEFLARHLIDRNDYFGLNAKSDYEKMIKWYAEDLDKAIEAYKEHLRNDSPKTVHWAMIEKDLITALERIQCQDSLEGARHNNQTTLEEMCAYPELRKNANCDACNIGGCEFDLREKEHACLQPSVYKANDCVNCESLLECSNEKDKHCGDCLLFDMQAQGNCNEPGYGTLATNNACDRFRLKVKNKNQCLDLDSIIGSYKSRENPTTKMEIIRHPFCPLSTYFEGDEGKCDVKNCDFRINGRDSGSCTVACKIIAERKKEN